MKQTRAPAAAGGQSVWLWSEGIHETRPPLVRPVITALWLPF